MELRKTMMQMGFGFPASRNIGQKFYIGSGGSHASYPVHGISGDADFHFRSKKGEIDSELVLRLHISLTLYRIGGHRIVSISR
jgi:hypothetical protein